MISPKQLQEKSITELADRKGYNHLIRKLRLFWKIPADEIGFKKAE